MANYEGPYAAELALALDIAASAGQMITTASRARWQSAGASASGGADNEPGTKKNSVDVSLSCYCSRCHSLPKFSEAEHTCVP